MKAREAARAAGLAAVDSAPDGQESESDEQIEVEFASDAEGTVNPEGGEEQEVTGRETAGAGAAAIVGHRHSLMGRRAL